MHSNRQSRETMRSLLGAVLPSAVVLATAAMVLLAGPAAVRHITFAQTEARILQASGRLAEGTILEQFSQATRDVALVIEPSVVHVSTRSRVRDSRGVASDLTASGSGWVYDAEGHIISNAHVVDGAEQIEVELHNGIVLPAELVARDLRTDIAVLKTRRGLLHPAARGSSETVRQGDLVFAFGSPFEFRFSMSSGIVSGLGRSTGQQDVLYENYIQVDAAINPGNSGGPLTDARGRVIGMNTAIATARNTPSGQGQFAGIGLAIPISMIESVADKLIRTGEAQRAFMGISVSPLTEVIRRTYDYDGQGAFVDNIVPGSPAERAGLRRADVITHINDRELTDRDRIPVIVATRAPGETISARVWRPDDNGDDGNQLEFTIVLEAFDPVLRTPEVTRVLQRFGLLDIDTATMQRAAAHGTTFERGAIVLRVRPGSNAERLLEPGSIITAVNDLPINTLDDLYVRIERLQLGKMIPIGATLRTDAILTARLPGGGLRRVRVGI